jgi:peptide deformylase
MMYRIIKYPDRRLLKKSEEVTRFGRELAKLAVAMKRLLIDTGNSGIAAPQVGKLKRIIVIAGKNSAPPLAMINPRVLETHGRQKSTEGCLSIPGAFLEITRPKKVCVKAQDILGNEFTRDVNGETARAVLHEIDHLSGILMWDHLPDDERERVINSYLESRQLAADA